MKIPTVVLALLLWPAAAAAQAPGGSELAGGTISRADASFAGAAEIGLKVSPQGDAVTIRAGGAAACAPGRTGFGEATGTGPLAADGSFALTLVDEMQQGQRGYKSSVIATGRITAGRATGTLDVRVDGPKKDDCRSEHAFTAVTVPDLSAAAPAAAPGGATLFGRMLTPLGPSGGPFSFVLRTSADGKTVRRMIFSFFNKCTGFDSLETTWFVPVAKVRADGSFRRTETGLVRWSNARESWSSVVEGRFVAGGAVGTARVRSVIRAPRGERVLGRCDSGAMRWSAIP